MERNVSGQARTGRDWIERERTSRGGAGCDVIGGDRARQDGMGRDRTGKDETGRERWKGV